MLAAGRGERLRPLTDRIPKPLLSAGGRTLIEWQIQRLAQAGIREIVVNVAHLGEQIIATLGGGRQYGVQIRYSREQQALETAGGIALALPALGGAPFVAVNADIFCDFDYASLARVGESLHTGASSTWAHLVLVPNPEHHSRGDFALTEAGRLSAGNTNRLTFSGIGVYRPEFFAGIGPGERRALGPMLHEAVGEGRVSGERHGGVWLDIGTPERLRQLRSLLGEPTQ